MATFDDLPTEILALILGRHLPPKWRFWARPVCRLWRDVCNRTAVATDLDGKESDGTHSTAHIHGDRIVGAMARGSIVCASALGEWARNTPTADAAAVVAVCHGAFDATPLHVRMVMIASRREDLVEAAISDPLAPTASINSTDMYKQAGMCTVMSSPRIFDDLARCVVLCCSLEQVARFFEINDSAHADVVTIVERDDPEISRLLLVGERGAERGPACCGCPWEEIGRRGALRTLDMLLDEIRRAGDPWSDLAVVFRATGFDCVRAAAAGNHVDVLNHMYRGRHDMSDLVPLEPSDLYQMAVTCACQGRIECAGWMAEEARRLGHALNGQGIASSIAFSVAPAAVAAALDWLHGESDLFDRADVTDQISLAVARAAARRADAHVGLAVMDYYRDKAIPIAAITNLAKCICQWAARPPGEPSDESSGDVAAVLDRMIVVLDHYDLVAGRGTLVACFDLCAAAAVASKPRLTLSFSGQCERTNESTVIACHAQRRCAAGDALDLAVLWRRWWRGSGAL
ncbi:F-box incomplete domain containing protein [Pandoravirus salinus]|uniref:F-box incomplete domain containing protein n=1 Tax=Pandoravirus salinus TaxID=1349410 RepID=S4VX56_9VIRU|nr:F-box incomplete domain [Pandoravirus salinus]AGO85259.1 F-box incomplete domain containing protein [Pandoravirus salinus]